MTKIYWHGVPGMGMSFKREHDQFVGFLNSAATNPFAVRDAATIRDAWRNESEVTRLRFVVRSMRLVAQCGERR